MTETSPTTIKSRSLREQRYYDGELTLTSDPHENFGEHSLTAESFTGSNTSTIKLDNRELGRLAVIAIQQLAATVPHQLNVEYDDLPDAYKTVGITPELVAAAQAIEIEYGY